MIASILWLVGLAVALVVASAVVTYTVGWLEKRKERLLIEDRLDSFVA